MMSSPRTAYRTLLVVIVISCVAFCSIAFGTIHTRAMQMRSTQIDTACVMYRDGPMVCK